jgi:autotransporter-associated beta strand protein
VATTGGNALTMSSFITGLQATSKTVTFDNVGNILFSGTVLDGVGTTAVAKSNVGTTTFTTDSFHTGGTSVLAGTLVAESAQSLGAGALAVSGGQLTLGSSTIVTTTGLTDFNWTGGVLKFDLGVDTTSDQLALAAAFMGSGSLVFDFNNTGVFNQPYTIVTFASTTFTDVSSFSATNVGGGLSGQFELTGNSLVFTPIPEPAIAALCFAGLGLLFLRKRREMGALLRRV